MDLSKPQNISPKSPTTTLSNYLSNFPEKKEKLLNITNYNLAVKAMAKDNGREGINQQYPRLGQ